MLKRTITYENFNGETVTNTFYFNLTKAELIELNVSYEGGFEKFLETIIAAQDQKTLIEEFKKIILISFGEKSPDGERFIKSDELREKFTQTAAYSALFMELATDANAASVFINSVIPKDMQAQVSKQAAVLPPPPPTSTEVL